MDNVFVVRFREFVKGEESAGCGNFDFCFEDETEAQKAMLEDIDEKVKCHADNEVNPQSSHTEDYGVVTFDNGNKYEWWIDKIGVVRAGEK